MLSSKIPSTEGIFDHRTAKKKTSITNFDISMESLVREWQEITKY